MLFPCHPGKTVSPLVSQMSMFTFLHKETLSLAGFDFLRFGLVVQHALSIRNTQCLVALFLLRLPLWPCLCLTRYIARVSQCISICHRQGYGHHYILHAITFAFQFICKGLQLPKMH